MVSGRQTLWPYIFVRFKADAFLTPFRCELGIFSDGHFSLKCSQYINTCSTLRLWGKPQSFTYAYVYVLCKERIVLRRIFSQTGSNTYSICTCCVFSFDFTRMITQYRMDLQFYYLKLQFLWLWWDIHKNTERRLSYISIADFNASDICK